MSRVGCFIALAMLVASWAAPAQTLIDWTEGPGRLGLGYPVPTPVDTPLPFAGFRSYAGLRTRHQDLAMTHDFIAPAIVGQTRYGRDIWAYRLGRGNADTFEGLPRAALQFNGGIHAREWQSPEVVTGLMELLAREAGDEYWIDYILDHSSIVVVPVLNVDGFLQTQRYPRSNWMDVDNRYPNHAPRDGRMRRKNLRGSDEDLYSVSGRLSGVDLNRNNEPAWPGPPSTGQAADLTYRGPSPASEPETQALIDAAELGPGAQLRFYADMHSYTRKFFSVETDNERLNRIQRRVLNMATNHHADLPGNKRYFNDPSHVDNGIGTTSEYFAHEFQVPALTWEIEPGNDAGAEYGGFANNSHDGFILPESEVPRVRKNLAETMAAIAYHMAGPPYIVRADLLDESGRFTHWSARWREAVNGRRELVTRGVRPLEPGREYRLRLVFSKPMRWRKAGEIVPFPGRFETSLRARVELTIDGQALEASIGEPAWSGEPRSWIGARPSYRENTLSLPIRVEDNQANASLLEQSTTGRATISVGTTDLTGAFLDADPATPVRFVNGTWQGYESNSGHPDTGGADQTLALDASPQGSDSIVPIGAGHTAMWFNPERAGEGWVLEILPGDRAVAYWFTFDQDGEPRWLVGNGEIEGNRIEFPELFAPSGAQFGDLFDPDDVETETVGSARMVFSGCSSGWYEYEAYDLHRTVDFQALTSTWAADSDPPDIPTILPDRALLSGSWYDPQQPGQGLTVQWISPDEMMLVWFTFDPDGRPYWLIGLSREGTTDPIVFPELQTVRGPVFGDDFDPNDRQARVWGRAELTLGCQQGLFEYETSLEGFQDGDLPLERLTELAGLGCDE
ncbi:MAG: M14 family zinc carboxypeptidase [Xanthomonadales bacterium]|nr:M14 family zinc carboxypeptidase [Xanthomonadales bacterium]